MKKVIDLFFKAFLTFALAWITFAFCLMAFMIYVHFTDEEKEQRIANEFAWKFDGNYKDYPGNIWYKAPKK